MIKSKTSEKIVENINIKDKNLSFNDFNKLALHGCQKILSFGEYSSKPNCNKVNKRKIIRYFYENYFKKIKINK